MSDDRSHEDMNGGAPDPSEPLPPTQWRVRLHPVDLTLGEGREDDLVDLVDILVGALKTIAQEASHGFEVFVAADGERSIRAKADPLGTIEAIANRALRDAHAKAQGSTVKLPPLDFEVLP